MLFIQMRLLDMRDEKDFILKFEECGFSASINSYFIVNASKKYNIYGHDCSIIFSSTVPFSPNYTTSAYLRFVYEFEKRYEFQMHFFRDKELEEIEDIFRNIGLFMFYFDKYFKQQYVSGNYVYSNDLNLSRVFVSDNRYDIANYIVSVGKEDELITLWQRNAVSENLYEDAPLFICPICELLQKEAEIKETLKNHVRLYNTEQVE